MSLSTLKPIYAKDYKALDIKIDRIKLTVQIWDNDTTVINESTIICKKKLSEIQLDGKSLSLQKIYINEKILDSSQYELNSTQLILKNPPKEFTLKTIVKITPKKNKTLLGLYYSKDMYCTQNEPEGFRHITYHIDRPDIMSIYTTRIEANQLEMPILLSNGILKDRGEINPQKNDKNQTQRHFALWEDPFPKPSYLYALVTGNLVYNQDFYTTLSGKKVDLRIYTREKDKNKTSHALNSLKKAMKWDEVNYNREYDLDLFMIVAIDDFNMGAMENKGLNLFNSSLVLADDNCATDEEFEAIESVIAHEYFHNWTGNRITCRDWFQLTLKEGLTVFRDQNFTADMTDETIKRIKDVSFIKTHQFPEDMGPNSHPIQPNNYIQIDNFYTLTIYEKGAEVIRMLYHLLGKNQFHKGMDKYFELYDGKAVTTEEFLLAMEIANQEDLSQFRKWYQQNGVPIIDVNTEHNSQTQVFKLKIKQKRALNDKNKQEGPLHFPVKLGLIDPIKSIAFKNSPESKVFSITQKEETLVFKNIPNKPVVSFLRDFTAPITVNFNQSLDELALLLKADTNPFNRYNASIKIASHYIESSIRGENLSISNEVISAYQSALKDKKISSAVKDYILSLPSIDELSHNQKEIDFIKHYKAKQNYMNQLTASLELDLMEIFESHQDPFYKHTKISVNRRRLKNKAMYLLFMLARSKSQSNHPIFKKTLEQYKKSKNMTDTFAALSLIAHLDQIDYTWVINDFLKKWQNDFIVLEKWFRVQILSDKNTLKETIGLTNHTLFLKNNPNHIRALYGSFTHNIPLFHKEDYSGYTFIIQTIATIDQFNPVIASGLLKRFYFYSKINAKSKATIKNLLKNHLQTKKLSSNTSEILQNTLKNNS